jgi:hypothetical protein
MRGVARILVMTLAFLSLAPGAFAQQAPPATGANTGGPRLGAGLGFGQVLMTGDLNTNFANHIGFNFNFSYESGNTFGLYVNLHINNHDNPNNPDDSLSLKGLTPNLKINLFRINTLTFSVLGGLGAYKVSETLGTREGSFFLFALDAGGMAMVDVGPNFRFGPSFTIINLASGTDNSNVASGQAPLTIGGNMFELFFNVMYLF